MNKLKQMRDLGRALVIAREFATHERWSAERLRSEQAEKLVSLVRHATENSPFYRELYGGRPIADASELETLPVIDKKTVMGNFDRLVTDPRLNLELVREHAGKLRGDEYLFGRYRVVSTSGTSGHRGLFVFDRGEWSIVLANQLRWQSYTGVAPRLPRRTRVASIGADTPLHVSRRITESANVGLFKVQRLNSTAPLAELVEALNGFQPEVLFPYPSIAALLADAQLEGELDIRPRVVATHSEVLTGDMAKRVKAAWGLSPFNHYGLTEEPHVGSDCAEHRGIHVFEDVVLLEIVDERNRPVPPGQTGRKCLLTNLYNRTQPLIRYEVSDMVARSKEPCPCGRPFMVIGAVEGRADDIIELESAGGGRVRVPPVLFETCVEALPGINEFQAVAGRDLIELRFVVRADVDQPALARTAKARLRSDLEAAGAVPPPIEIRFVRHLERPARGMGKLKTVQARPGH